MHQIVVVQMSWSTLIQLRREFFVGLIFGDRVGHSIFILGQASGVMRSIFLFGLETLDREVPFSRYVKRYQPSQPMSFLSYLTQEDHNQRTGASQLSYLGCLLALKCLPARSIRHQESGLCDAKLSNLNVSKKSYIHTEQEDGEAILSTPASKTAREG